MKQKSLVLGISFGFLLSVFAFATVKKQVAATEASVGNYSTDAATYYNDITASSGQLLAAQLHDLITSTHRTYTYYSDNGANGYQKNTDQYYEGNEKVNGYIYEFYSGVKWPNTWDPQIGSTTGGYNREHVWPQAQSNGLWGQDGGGADMHHLRPSENRLNGDRGNHRFGTVSSRDSHKLYAQYGTDSTYALGGYDSGSVFEPLDSKKGDVARIVMYVYLHYNSYSVSQLFGSYGTTNGNGSSGYFASSLLSLTKVVSASNEDAARALMMEWNTADPVDDIERRRNEQVATYQGNRNPFIDHPEYANALWGTPEPGVSISATSKTISVGGNATLSASSTDSSTITWSTSNADVASLSSTSSTSGGTITITGVSAGTATITASATIGGTPYSKTCSVTVNSSPAPQTKTLSSITLSNITSQYTLGESFIKPTVTAHYSDTSSAVVTDSTTFSGYNMNTAGDYTVTASYTEKNVTKTAEFEISVTTNPAPEPGLKYLTGITISNEKTEYTVGDPFVKPTVVATYSNQTTQDVSESENLAFTGQRMSEAGTYTVKAVYTEGRITVEATYQITVAPKPASGGCGGNIAVSSIAISSVALVGIALLIIKKRKEHAK